MIAIAPECFRRYTVARPPRHEFRMRIRFDQDSAPARYLGSGWSSPANGRTWAIGDESWLLLPAPAGRSVCLLTLSCAPFVQPGHLDRQRVALSVNGYDLAEFAVATQTSIVSLIPQDVVADKAALCIRLRHPDNARPADFRAARNGDQRRLAIAYQTLSLEEVDADAEHLLAEIKAGLSHRATDGALHTTPPLPQAEARTEAASVMAAFQSAGDDCEFGFVQRRLGTEALGLFRFASIAAADLMRGLRSGFAELATPESLEIRGYPDDPTRDYMGFEANYGIRYHTLLYPTQIEASALKTREMKRLRLLARKFLEDVELGEHLFVVKRKLPLPVEEIACLLAAVRRRGPAWLLWVREADAQHAPGTVEHVTTGLIAGYIDRIAEFPLMKTMSVDGWIAVCRAAHALWRHISAPGAPQPALRPAVPSGQSGANRAMG